MKPGASGSDVRADQWLDVRGDVRESTEARDVRADVVRLPVEERMPPREVSDAIEDAERRSGRGPDAEGRSGWGGAGGDSGCRVECGLPGRLPCRVPCWVLWL